MNNLSKILKNIQNKSTLTQDETAEKMGISVRSYQRFEKDPESDIKKLKKFASIFGVDYNMLIEELKENNKIKETTMIYGDKVKVKGIGNTTLTGNININTKQFNHSEDIEEIINLLQYAPSEFLSLVKDKLKKYKEITHL